MPEETDSGILCGPLGHAEAIDKDEHAKLAGCLNIIREGNASALYHALEAILEIREELGSEPEREDVIRKQISRFLFNGESRPRADHQDSRGILGGQLKQQPFEMLSEDELEILGHTVTAIRKRGWFVEWLAGRVHDIAESSPAAHGHPSPLEIAGTLTLDITNWQEHLAAAKRLAARRPDLLFPTLHAPPAEPEASAEPEAAPTPAKRQRARKRGRKAA